MSYSKSIDKETFISQFKEGKAHFSRDFLGCHKLKSGGHIFRVWAPFAKSVRILGDFNHWDKASSPMEKIGGGIFEGIIENSKQFDCYKYLIEKPDGTFTLKSDPYALHFATRPENASKVYDFPDFSWTDKDYMKNIKKKNSLSSPINILEVHLGSFKKFSDGNFYSYRHFADEITEYAKKLNYTHIELMPVSEYPFDPSWGYQATGYFAPTSRYGTPEDFCYLINKCHRENIGVIIDFVGSHFPKDECGLYEFDGTACYEYSDPLKNEHAEWDTRIFDFGKGEVRSFLISAVIFFLDKFHVDGIRFDAVSSMLYLDYGKEFFRPNEFGGKENLEAIEFLKELNKSAFALRPDILMIAEESTAFPKVSHPTYLGGLGFNLKWNMGWMHDTLNYFKTDPLFRSGNHNSLTFSLTYAFFENFVLPFSHDEVVYGKGSLIEKMPGDYNDKFSNLRALFSYMIAHPGKKLSFMGNEFAQFSEWDFKKELDWFLLSYPMHKKFHRFISDLNKLYLNEKAFYENDFDWDGFKWISLDDKDLNIISFLRTAKDGESILCACNFCPVQRKNYVLGLPYGTNLTPIFSSNYKKYGGSGVKLSTVTVKEKPAGSFPLSAKITLPGLSVTFYRVKNN